MSIYFFHNGKIEKDDFASSTSSRSTKLIHGGIRYLEKAVKSFDPGQLELVFDALHERSTLLDIAPHLTKKIPILTPCYTWWELPYYWIGLKMYDLLSLNRRLASSRWVSAKESKLQFPMINAENLKGAVVYYDGQMDDSRMGISLALTACSKGANIVNHVEVIDFKKSEDGKIKSAIVRDTLTNETWEINAKVFINATGPYADIIRKLDDKDSNPIISPSIGTHITLPDYYSPLEMGLVVPKTIDGRVIFMLPWKGKTIAGTTDVPTKITHNPKPTEEEISFILNSISKYLSVKVRREDVLAAWSGIRPLVTDPNAVNTESILRDHFIDVSKSGLLTIAGGKWTTYRLMAKDAVDKAIEIGNLPAKSPCTTQNTKLIGASGWNNSLFLTILQDYRRLKKSRGTLTFAPMTSDIAQHLSNSYGVRALIVADIAQRGYGKRLAHNHPYIEAEVVYAVEHELACTAIDVIARRLRLAFVDHDGSHQALPRTIEIMGDLLNWDDERKSKEMESAIAFLDNMK